jgi:VWFA-related protein
MSRTRRRGGILGLIVAASLCGGLKPAAYDQTGQNPTFRGRTDLLMLDVSVLDEKTRQPIKDLTAGDFTVMVDGKPRPVVAFKFVDMPPPPPPLSLETASWVREVSHDLVTNERAPGRVVAIMIDDKTIEATRLDPFQIQKARQAALNVVDELGPNDRAAVVFTKNAHSAQSFTSDRRLLQEAIAKATIIPEPKVADPDTDPQCLCQLCSIEALDDVAKSLRSLPEQRKVLFFVSAGPLLTPPPDGPCNTRRRSATYDALRSLHAANVTIQAVDPTGLESPAIAKAESSQEQAAPSGNPLFRQEYLRMISEQTGGRAIVNDNDPDRHVPSLFAESSSYYLLGVEPPPASEGKLHDVDVRLNPNRRDVDVRTRRGYYDTTEKDRAIAAAVKLDNGPLTPIIAGPIHTSGVALGVTAAPFAGADGKATIAVALHVGLGDAAAGAATRTETVEVVASAYIPETGDNAGWSQQKLSLTWPPIHDLDRTKRSRASACCRAGTSCESARRPATAAPAASTRSSRCRTSTIRSRCPGLSCTPRRLRPSRRKTG